MPNTQLEKLKDITPINLGVNDIAIAKMKEEYGNLTASTPKEFKELEAGIAVFRKARLMVVERKDDLKRPLIDEGKAIDAECKRLVALIEQPEETLKERKKAYEGEQDRKKKEKEEAEAKRIKTIEDRINAFFVNTRGLVGKSSTELKEKLQFFISCTETDDFDYQEFAIKADGVKRTVLAELQEAYKAKVEQDNKDAQIEKERLELAQLRKEKADKDKKELEEAKVAEEKFNAVVADADKVFISDVATPAIETKPVEVAPTIKTSHSLSKVYPTIEDIYHAAKIAETKGDFEEFGYQEYFNGLYTMNDVVTAFVELYEKSR